MGSSHSAFQEGIRHFLSKTFSLTGFEGKPVDILDRLGKFCAENVALIKDPERTAVSITRTARQGMLRIALEGTEFEELVGKPTHEDLDRVKEFSARMAAISVILYCNDSNKDMRAFNNELNVMKDAFEDLVIKPSEVMRPSAQAGLSKNRDPHNRPEGARLERGQPIQPGPMGGI